MFAKDEQRERDINWNKTGGLGRWFGVGGKAFFFALKLLQFWNKIFNKI